MIHLTVLPSKHYTSHYLLKRALEHTDVLQCAKHAPVAADRGAMTAALPGENVLQGVSTYDMTKIWCKGYADGCQLIPPGAASDARALPPAAPASGAADSHPAPPVDVSPIRPPLGSVDEEELPGAAQELMRRTAARSWDKRTVILLFATNDFMDKELAHNFDGFESPPALLLPRVARGDVEIIKLNVIGERQRFGLRVLEAGYNVLFADLDNIFLKSPEPLLRDGDIIGERIWGRPMSLVKKWGAAIR